MNNILKRPVEQVAYGFVDPQFLPKGKDEYHLRNIQNKSGISYRQLTASEIEMLVRNNNTSDDWNKLLVSDAFNADLVQNCSFLGLVRIGKLERYFLEFRNLRLPVGLYNSTIISCDFGDNVVIDNVNYLAHYIIGNEVIITNVNELATTSTAKFGNGIVKEGEKESIRIWLEVCNENAGRAIIPFNGMLPGDAFMWARFRNDEKLLDKFRQFTEDKFDRQRGYYGKIGDRTVIKHSRMIKDVWMGTDVYMKGANKIKNITINSSAESPTQIGEGCELVNGVIGEGCKVFYGVKAVRFIMASHSQLKYGARLINSYLGNNSTISCCEVLNSLIFPFHEQHHNNSFLCASRVEGQSNMAAGATVGSNHNSRGADGEIQAGRGFWPGLCVSLKHNSRFASFTMISKGDYPAELDIRLPFSLISNDVHLNRLTIMPAYWFLYNLYALSRNEWKYAARDLRKEKIQRLETSYLAPDTVNEIMGAMKMLELYTGRAWHFANKKTVLDDQEDQRKGKQLLAASDPNVDELEILATGFENSKRKAVLLKVREAYRAYAKMVTFYAATQLLRYLQQTSEPARALSLLPKRQREEWINLGGQLVPLSDFNKCRKSIYSGKLKGWHDVHSFYLVQSAKYEIQVLEHAVGAYLELTGAEKANGVTAANLFKESIGVLKWITEGISDSRLKDYENPFRQMAYENRAEMEKVIGRLDDDGFIQSKKAEAKAFESAVKKIMRKLGGSPALGKQGPGRAKKIPPVSGRDQYAKC